MNFVNTSVFLCTTVLIAVSKRSCESVVEYLPVMYTFKKTPNSIYNENNVTPPPE